MLHLVHSKSDYPVIDQSDAFYRRAKEIIPAATQTLAKGPGQHLRGVAPKYLARGKGSHVWDVDGNEFLDYSMGIGSISLGYCYGRVDDAIRQQLANGITFSLMHPLEVEVAELLIKVVPGIEMVRFSKTGYDVTSAAVRLARAFTGREKVLCCGYHGWHDWSLSVTDRHAGMPQSTRDLSFTYNDITSVLDAVEETTACVILEPVVCEEPQDGFLEALREICTARGVVLVFNEMWTGFRLATGGAQEYFDVRADLVCYSRAVANGMPLAVLAGRREIMQLVEREAFFFTTFGGEALSLAAALATVMEIQERGVPLYLHRQGKRLKEGYNTIADDLGMTYTRCVGMDFRTRVTFDPSAGDPLLMESFLQQEMIRLGILWSGFHMVSFSHTDDDIAFTLDAYAKVLPLLRDAVATGTVRDQLRRLPVEPVFRRTGNFNIKPAVPAGSPR